MRTESTALDLTLISDEIKSEFPVFNVGVDSKPLIYLDSAASTQKPSHVIDRIKSFYESEYSNVHRGVYDLAYRATETYEASREIMAEFIGADSATEIVFTSGTTESINLVARSYLEPELEEDDEIIITQMEHHSNIVPWQMLCEETGAVLKIAPITGSGELDFEGFTELLSEKTKMVAVTHVSNVLGTVLPIKEIVEAAHRWDVPVLVDGAQAVAHIDVDVTELDCDFYAFSGHKVYGPSGIGVLYGKAKLLNKMKPWQGGGEMIRAVSFEKTTFNSPPYRFEAGTPNIAGAIGLGAAIEWLRARGMESSAVIDYALEKLEDVSDLTIIGNPAKRIGVISFIMQGVHAHDLATILDREGIAVRAGHHCCQPLMDYLGLPATTRVSFGIYNTLSDVDALIDSLENARRVFGL